MDFVGGANDGSSVYQVSHRYALQMEEALLQAEAQLASAELLFATDALSHGPPPQLDLPDGLDSNFLHGVLARLDPGGMDAAAVLRRALPVQGRKPRGIATRLQ